MTPGSGNDRCDDGKTYDEVIQLCGEYTGPNGNNPPGSWVPVSIENFDQFLAIDTEIIQAEKNGCTKGKVPARLR